MIREIDLIGQIGVDRQELRVLRKTGEFQEGRDWLLFGKAVCWTDTGLRLLSERLSVDLGDLVPDEPAEAAATVLRARILNPRLIRVVVDGEREPSLVNVGDNALYKPGMRVMVRRVGNGWRGNRRPKAAKGE